MATIAEFYSKNLSHEAKKALHEKAKRGGTPGYAPMGYLNVVERVDGKEVKSCGVGPGESTTREMGFRDLRDRPMVHH